MSCWVAYAAAPTPTHAMLAVVEDLGKRREPLPQLVGIYFIAPTDTTIRQLVRDFSLATMPQYKAAHVFFSSKPTATHLAAIKECPALVSRLRTLKEVRVLVRGLVCGCACSLGLLLDVGGWRLLPVGGPAWAVPQPTQRQSPPHSHHPCPAPFR